MIESEDGGMLEIEIFKVASLLIIDLMMGIGGWNEWKKRSLACE